jgi:hypothetical protein
MNGGLQHAGLSVFYFIAIQITITKHCEKGRKFRRFEAGNEL